MELQELGVDDFDGVLHRAPDHGANGDHLLDRVLGGAHGKNLGTRLVPDAIWRNKRTKIVLSAFNY